VYLQCWDTRDTPKKELGDKWQKPCQRELNHFKKACGMSSFGWKLNQFFFERKQRSQSYPTWLGWMATCEMDKKIVQSTTIPKTLRKFIWKHAIFLLVYKVGGHISY
jgi:hypothetical protein